MAVNELNYLLIVMYNWTLLEEGKHSFAKISGCSFSNEETFDLLARSHVHNVVLGESKGTEKFH